MADSVQQVINWINEYYGDKQYLILAGLAYLYLFVMVKDARKKIVYPCLLLLFFVLNPYLYKYIFSNIIYWRLFWMFPNAIVIGYAIVSIVDKCKSKISKLVIITFFAVCIMYKGVNVYSYSGMILAQNQQKVDTDVEAICDYILSVSEHPRCIMPHEWLSQVRQYSGDIEMMYGRNADGFINTIDDMSRRIDYELMKENPDFSYVFGQAFIKKYDFVVVEESKFVEDTILQQYGYSMQTTIKGYSVYYHADIEQRKIDGWVVTQYGPNAGLSTCYTIEDEDGNLIVIDGGYAWYENQLRSIIREHGNHVSAWILTSMRNEHSGAFCEIMENPKGVKVDSIYTEYVSDENYRIYKDNVEATEDSNTVEHCIKLIQTLSQVKYVQENDVLDIIGLEIKILHVWDESTNAIETWHILDGTIAFSVKGKEQNMLFCSDLTARSEQLLLEHHLTDLNAEVVQLNNHGIYSFSDYMYDIVSPKVAFVDLSYEQYCIDGPASYSYTYMMNHGVHCYTYETIPNWIILK